MFANMTTLMQKKTTVFLGFLFTFLGIACILWDQIHAYHAANVACQCALKELKAYHDALESRTPPSWFASWFNLLPDDPEPPNTSVCDNPILQLNVLQLILRMLVYLVTVGSLTAGIVYTLVLRRKLATIKEKHFELDSHNKEKLLQIKRVENQMEILMSRDEERLHQLELVEEQNKMLKNRDEERLQHLESLKTEITKMKSQHKDLLEYTKKLEIENSKAKSRDDERIKHIQTLKDENAQANNHLRTLEGEIAMMKSHHTGLLKSNRSLEVENQSLLSRIRDHAQEIDTLKQEISILVNNQRSKKDMKMEIEKLKKENSLLSERLNVKLDRTLKSAEKLIELGDFTGAIKLYSNVQEFADEENGIKKLLQRAHNLQKLFSMARTHMVEQRFLHALQEIELAQKYACSCKQLKIMQAECLTQLDRPDDALYIINSLLKEGHKDAEIYNLAGSCLSLQGHFTSAIEHFQEALKLSPTNEELTNKIKATMQKKRTFAAYTALYSEHRYIEAIHLLDSALSLGSFDKAADLQMHYLKALALANLLSYELCVAECDKCIEIKDSHAPAYFLRSYCRMNLQDYEKTLEDLEKVSTLHHRIFNIDDHIYNVKVILDIKKNNPDPYEILGVTKNTSMEDINRAYRKLALKYHPDKHTNSDNLEEIQNKSRLVNDARDVLRDTEKKASYDANMQEISLLRENTLEDMAADIE